METLIDIKFPYASELLAFYNKKGRQLPWRNEKDLYRIWVSEIMLQQTGVATVLGYYNRFLEKFPTVAQLAAANKEEILKVWQGLGYYRRAANLHRAAQEIHYNLGGSFPDTFEGWLALPGVGQSTAGAILAIGRNQNHAILDGNCKRVLARISALSHPVDNSQGNTFLWQLARQLTPSHQPGDYAQAIMDLGATVCTPKDPHCPECPWQQGCRAWMSRRVNDFPVRKQPKIRPRYEQIAVVVCRPGEQVIMHQRPEGGLLGGLWEPLSLSDVTSNQMPPEADRVTAELQRHWQVIGQNMRMQGKIRHAFTHFHLTVWVYVCHYVSGWPGKHEKVLWAGSEPWEIPLSTLHAKVMSLALSQNRSHRSAVDDLLLKGKESIKET
ncbi:MAG: A/G-specific adenine glycosylase [Magnetococcales bacterium]|nr:A/G-specific adenine glycosylase [Magnetococcales bacterium]